MNKESNKDHKERKKSYRSPKLVTFGEIGTLTRQQGPGPADDAGNNRMGFGSA